MTKDGRMQRRIASLNLWRGKSLEERKEIMRKVRESSTWRKPKSS